jgi:Ca-activated chloride channel family protein
MTFEWPFALVALLLVPLFAGAYVMAQRTRRRDTLRYSSVAMVGVAVGKGPGRKRHVPAVLYLVALGLISLALARPQMKLPALDRTSTVMLVLDISGSMRADDIKPTRIDAATATIREFVKQQPKSVKIGLIGFAQQAQVLNEPTDKKDLVLRSIATIYLQRGTNIGDGLQLAMDVLLAADGAPLQTAQTPQVGAGIAPRPARQVPKGALSSGSATIILLSDGAATTGPPPLQIAKELAQTGVKVHTVGLGALTSGGGPSAGFFNLDEPTLRGIAETTGGRYYPARDAGELHRVYGELSRETSVESRYAEATWAAGGLGMLVMLLAGALGMLWTNRLP